MPVGAVIGGAVIGAGASIYGSNRAADAATDASGAAVAESRRQFDIQRQDLLPYIQTGQGALSQLARLYGIAPAGGNVIEGTATRLGDFDPRAAGGRTINGPYGGRGQARLPAPSKPQPAGPDMSVFFESPDYQFNKDETQQAVDRSLAARGKALSGQGVKEGARYASNLASREFGSFFDRLSTLAGIGQTGAAASAAAGSTSASQVGQAVMQGGQIQSNARTSAAAGVNSAIQGGLSNYMLLQYLGKPAAA